MRVQKKKREKKAPNKGKTGIYGLCGKEAANTCMNLGCKKKKEKRNRQQVEAILFPFATAEQEKDEKKKGEG